MRRWSGPKLRRMSGPVARSSGVCWGVPRRPLGGPPHFIPQALADPQGYTIVTNPFEERRSGGQWNQNHLLGRVNATEHVLNFLTDVYLLSEVCWAAPRRRPPSGAFALACGAFTADRPPPPP